MLAQTIRQWRPTKFEDIVGADNRRRLQRLQRSLQKGRIPSPILLVGVYGYGKTSVARLAMKALCCERRDAVTADPCNECNQCRCFGHYYNECGHPYRRIEVDCTTFGPGGLTKLLDEKRFDNRCALFFDELHHLHERHAQEPLMKFLEDFEGLIMAAVMEDRVPDLLPPLLERFQVLQLTAPTDEEMVEFFLRKAADWQIGVDRNLVQMLVEVSGQSFRKCKQALAEAAEEGDRRMTRSLIITLFA